MKTKGFYLMAIIPMLACCFSLFAQEPNKIVPVSPEAAALAKMVNYPVNLNTGIPDINIPFYEINVGGMSLPITLNYHAGGFRINEQATRAGLGWSLSSDLQITRTVNGLNDFAGSGKGYLANTLLKTFYANFSICTTCSYPLYSTSPFPYANAYDLASGDKDGMPDKFTYKLLNKSGSFYFLKNHTGGVDMILPVPYDNIKIQYNEGEFIITDTDGTVYYFGESGGGDVDQVLAKGIEVSGSMDDMRNCSNCVRSAWKCKRIVNSTKTDEITFAYTPKTVSRYRSYSDNVTYYSNENPCNLNAYYTSNNYPLQSISNYEGIGNNGIPFYQISSPKYMVVFANGPSIFHIPHLDAQNNVIDKTFPLDNNDEGSHTNVAGLSLSTISFRGGKVEFNGKDQLNYIRVLDDINNELKSMHFFHSYTNAVHIIESKSYNGENFMGTRYLDSLHIKNGSNVFERYALLYNNKFCYGNHLKGHDAWNYPNANTVEIAYANNKMGNIFTLPTQKIIQPRYYFEEGCTSYASNILITIEGDAWAQVPDEVAMQKGILKRIVYPTGGYVDFDFEANKYEEEFSNSDYSTLPQLAGGLRIRSINYYEPDNSELVTQKYYRYGDLEQGTGIILSKPQRSMESGSYHLEAANYSQQVAYVTNPLPHQSCIEPTCLSVEAVETKTIYQPASTLDYTYSNGSPIYYTTVTEYQQDLGSQTGKTVYEYYTPDHFYNYEAPFVTESRISGTNISRLKTDGLMGIQKSVTTYKVQTDRTYSPVYRKNYAYLRYLYPKQIRVAYAFMKIVYQVMSGGYSGTQRDLYNNSLTNFNLEDEYVAGEYGIPSGRVLLQQEEEIWYENAGTRTNTTTYTYDKLPYLQPSKISKTNSKGDSIVRSRKYAYDFNGVSIYDQMRVDNMISQVVEEVETNVTKNQELSRKKINYATWPIGWDLIAPISVQSSVKGQPLETDILFDGYDHYGNVLQLTGNDGIPISYLWGYKNLYPVAELKGVTYASIPSSYISNVQIINPLNDASLRTLLNDLRNSFGEQKEVTTYTYKRLVGKTSFTAPNKLQYFYEFDPIGRLTIEKDHTEKIVKKYEYNTMGPLYASINNINYTNFPIMRTLQYECSPGVWQVYNYIIRGGTYSGYSAQSVKSTAFNAADALVFPSSMISCPPESRTAKVELRSAYVPSFTIPTMLEIDFIKDGSVYSTYRIKSNSIAQTEHDYSTIYLPVGEYQISIRPNADINYEGGYLKYTITDVGENSNLLISGNSFVLEKDKYYIIEAINF